MMISPHFPTFLIFFKFSINPNLSFQIVKRKKKLFLEICWFVSLVASYSLWATPATL